MYVYRQGHLRPFLVILGRYYEILCEMWLVSFERSNDKSLVDANFLFFFFMDNYDVHKKI